MQRMLPYFAAAGMALIFGFSFLFTKNALESLDIFQLLFLRFLIAFLGMSVLILLRVAKINFRGKNLKPLVMVATIEPVIYFIMETYGLKYATSSEAGVMMSFIPIIVAILGYFLLNEKLNNKQVASIILSVIGVILLVVMSGKMDTGGQLKGTLFLLGAVSAAALYNIFSKKASVTFTPFEITYFMMLLGTVCFGAVAIVSGIIDKKLDNFLVINDMALAAILYLGIASSIGAFFLVNYALSKLPAFQSAVFTNLIAVVSVFAGIVFRNETFELYKLYGAILIIAGVFGTNYFETKKTKNPVENE